MTGRYSGSCTFIQACLASEPELRSPAIQRMSGIQKLEVSKPLQNVIGCVHNSLASGGTWVAGGEKHKEITSSRPDFST